MTLTPLAAFAGGVLTLLAPCSVMVLPAFLASAFSSPRALLARTGVFWLGLLTTLLPLGVLAGSLGSLLRQHMGLLTTVGGLVVVGLGVAQALSVPMHLPFVSRLDRGAGRSRERGTAGSALAVYLLGVLYGLAGVGCAGPVLGAVLVTAGLGGSPLGAAGLMVLYSAGMVLPLGVLALLWDGLSLGSRPWLRPRVLRVLGRTTTLTELVAGATFMTLGLLMVVVGPSGLGGGLLSSETTAGLEQRLIASAAEVPSWLLVALVGVLLAAVAAVVTGRRR